MNAKTFSSLPESLISGPKKRRRTYKDRRYEVGIGHTNAKVVQTTALNHLTYFTELRHAYLWQKIEQLKRLSALPQRSKSKFSDNERMNRNLPMVKLSMHRFVYGRKVSGVEATRTEMINPN